MYTTTAGAGEASALLGWIHGAGEASVGAVMVASVGAAVVLAGAGAIAAGAGAAPVGAGAVLVGVATAALVGAATERGALLMDITTVSIMATMDTTTDIEVMPIIQQEGATAVTPTP